MFLEANENKFMKSKLILLIILIFLIGSTTLQAQTGMELRDSVVKVFVHSNLPNFYKPWEIREGEFTTGSGCVIAGNQILTSAHVVSDATFIQVKKGADPKKYVAEVTAIENEADLAILTVEDESFFKDTEPFELGKLPMLKDSVTVIGYPRGGSQLSVTEGVVSRIDVTPYAYSGKGLIAVQIDAAINPGNSGGPVVQDGKLIGVAFQGLKESENIGYIVPVPIIEHFFKDLEDGKVDGFPVLGILTNKTENPGSKQYFGLEDDGIVVTKVIPDSSAYGHIQEEDVVLSVNGVSIAADGTVEFRKGERVVFTAILNEKQIGESVELEILRNGKVLKQKIKTKPFTHLVPRPYYFKKPTYYVFGGLVFSILSNDLLRSWDSNWGPLPTLEFGYYKSGPGRMRLKNRDEICVLMHALPDAMNVGYQQLRFQVIDKVNGEQIDSFKELVEKLQEENNGFTIIDTEQFGKIIIDRSKLAEADPRIQKKYRISSLYSDDVAEWL